MLHTLTLSDSSHRASPEISVLNTDMKWLDDSKHAIDIIAESQACPARVLHFPIAILLAKRVFYVYIGICEPQHYYHRNKKSFPIESVLWDTGHFVSP